MDGRAPPKPSRGQAPGSPGRLMPRAVPLSYDRLNREDMASSMEPLSAWGSEVAAFVRVYFGDGQDCGPASAGSMAVAVSNARLSRGPGTDPETGKDGAQLVWVENAKTKKLMPVRVRASDLGGQAGSAEEEREDEGEDASLLLHPPPLRGSEGPSPSPSQGPDGSDSDSNTSAAALLAKVTFFLCQGLLAGFAFSSSLVQQANQGAPTKLLLDYHPLASEYRRLFYILAALSAVGSVDCLLATLSRANRPSLGSNGPHGFGAAMVQREAAGSVTVAAGAALLHLVAFLLTVLMGAFDVLVAVRNGAAPADQASGAWAALALGGAAFSRAFATWQRLETGRLVCAILAWLMSCLLVWRELLAVEGRGREMNKMKDSLLAWKRRAQELEGDGGLDELDGASLQRLLAAQALGYERTAAALRVQQML